MRTTLLATIVLLAGCASSHQLAQNADTHMANARGAAATGNYELARAEQRKAEKDYQRAVSRAYEQNVPAPPPPTGAPMPVFDPQMQR